MTKQEIIDKFWMEFINFYRELAKAAKKEESDSLSSGGHLLDLLVAPEKFKKNALYEQFSTPDEPTFWRWYALIKLNIEGQSEKA